MAKQKRQQTDEKRNVKNTPDAGEKEPSSLVILGLAVVVIGIIIAAFVLLSRGSPEQSIQSTSTQTPDMSIPAYTTPITSTPKHVVAEDNEARHLLPLAVDFPENWSKDFTLDIDKNLVLNATGFTSGHAMIYKRTNKYGGMATTTLHGIDNAMFTNVSQAQAYFSAQQTQRKGKAFSNNDLKNCFVSFIETKSTYRGFLVCQESAIVFEVLIITPKIGDETKPQQMLELLVGAAKSASAKLKPNE